MTRDIGFFVFPKFQILDLTGPLSAFQIAGRQYRLHVISPQGGLVPSSAGLDVMTTRAEERYFDTLVIAGGNGARAGSRTEALPALVRDLASRSRRVASVCTGAFLLAAAGILDSKRATTHWRRAADLQKRFPGVAVDRDCIYIKDGSVWTSAGISAGIDLALALIEDDLGAEAARAVAQELVVYHRRPGGQSQFSAMLELEPDSDRVRRALGFAREHLHEPLPVERLAEAACLSPRQFGRAFRAETGETPAKAVERLRAEAARVRIESGSEPIESIAVLVGFKDPERMRRAFLRLYGQPPQALKRAARALRVVR
ncbi:GlxA family transcriptional regulator [Phyllobacterium myrsinacearum]|uniref:Transcriptional regulator GlxA family with amidase domain n=1 Tax=Phyllobacterium myrsinacearum TaxID=28101 RepID=A0A839EPC3_9HYPH|nr:GlxA family transcriptional regulator [Phyllobacterium myrsinacearum]MBA8880739.1 transcriptional regulator GlxA family with amidase domain [Phyllobacterium myrsinacearum]